LEQVLGFLRLRAGDRVHVGRLAAGGLTPSDHDDGDQDPDPDRDPLVSRRGPTDAIEEACPAYSLSFLEVPIEAQSTLRLCESVRTDASARGGAR
jgi:hypothetical protein